MDFPRYPVESCEPPPGILKCLGTQKDLSSRYDHDEYTTFLFELGSEKQVRNLSPDFRALERESSASVIVTSASASDEYDFVYRYFAPFAGIDEDPVTGSAQCYLGPYWAMKVNRRELRSVQVSKRTGIVQCTVTDELIHIRGQACTIFKGDLRLHCGHTGNQN